MPISANVYVHEEVSNDLIKLSIKAKPNIAVAESGEDCESPSTLSSSRVYEDA